ncbi:MAG: phosphoglycerate dehydrogenase [Methylocystis sp.]|nr:phosphoglycerate dehydrogenase [Methylocystis sp.]
MRAIVTTAPFADIDAKPVQLLAKAGIETVINPLGRTLRPEEVAGIIDGFDVVIAGTEVIGAAALASPRLKAICRVGVGLDGINLLEARRRGIAVSYTPDGPSAAVAELTVGLAIDANRGVGAADRKLRQGLWQRHTGRGLRESVVGVVGCGRIGSRVIGHLLGGFPGVRILAHDIRSGLTFPGSDKVSWVDLPTLLREADIITLHVPFYDATCRLIGRAELAAMKTTSVLINTARGGIVDEMALAEALTGGRIAAAAIDVFEEEPYTGPLTQCENAILTCHMGSMTRDCRLRMEVEAAEEVVRFAQGRPLSSPAPDAEYDLAARRPRRGDRQ